MKVNDLALVENIGILREHKVVLYGAGWVGNFLHRKLKSADMSASYICDDDTSKQGKFIGDLKIISPTELKGIDEREEIAIIIAVANEGFLDQIVDAMNKLELRTDKVFTFLAFEISWSVNFFEIGDNEKRRDIVLKTRENLDYYNKPPFELDKSEVFAKYFDGVLVYTPTKVGSLSVHYSLMDAGVVNIQRHSILAYKHAFDFDAEYFSELKRFILDRDCVKIITLVREPIARALSLFFHMEISLKQLPFMSFYTGKSLLSVCNEYIKKEPLIHTSNREGRQFEWFDHEIKELFDIDVFEYPFDREKGYTIIRQGNVEVLLMKLEKLNTLEGVIGEFVGAPHFKLAVHNDSDKKMIRFLYRDVKEKIKIPRGVFDRYYKGNACMDHFYTEEEKAAFLKKWERNIED